MELPFWGQIGFLWAPNELRGCTATSSARANQVPPCSSPLCCLWLRPCEALLKLSSSTSTLPKSSREAFTAVKCWKAKKPHSLETPETLLKSLTLAIHWSMYKVVVMSKALIPNLMGEKLVWDTISLLHELMGFNTVSRVSVSSEEFISSVFWLSWLT